MGRADFIPRQKVERLAVEHLEAGRFHVTSQSEPESKRYLVDVKEWGGKGQCECMHFATRVEPEWKRFREFPACKHIRAARNFLASKVIAMMPDSGLATD